MVAMHQHILKVAQQRGVFRAQDLPDHPSVRRHLTELVDAGDLVRIRRGLYRATESDLTEHHSLVEAARAVPDGVICLLSALAVHNLTTELPSRVWIAIGPKAWKPRLDRPSLRIARFSGDALTQGVELRSFEGVDVKVYNPAKTVADCFKYRNKIGTSVAIEALRDAWRTRAATAAELWHYAGICRVQRVMTPYMESLK